MLLSIGNLNAHAETSRFLCLRTKNWSKYICIVVEMEIAYVGSRKVTSENRSASEGRDRTL